MNINRPYQFVPTIALIILIEAYDKMIREGDFKKQQDFDLMYAEFEFRINIKKEEDKQITIEEYMKEVENDECCRKRNKNH